MEPRGGDLFRRVRCNIIIVAGPFAKIESRIQRYVYARLHDDTLFSFLLYGAEMWTSLKFNSHLDIEHYT